MKPIRPATTVILLRDLPGGGFETFLAKRNRTIAFLPNAWVFPGGRVDNEDHLLGNARVKGGAQSAVQMGLTMEKAIAHLVAGVRETFEETGIWLGQGDPPQTERVPLSKGDSVMASLLQNHELSLDLDVLSPWAWWVTPEIETKRYDTRFLVTQTSHRGGVHDQSELVDSIWITPEAALARVEEGTMGMVPPTWWTLKELMGYATVADVMAEAALRRPIAIQPIARLERGFELILPGHELHTGAKVPGLPASIRFESGRWFAE